MTRKEELQVLISHTKESVSNLEAKLKQKLEDVKEQFINVLVNGLKFEKKHIHKVYIDGSKYVRIYVVNPDAKDDSRKTAGELTIYLKDYNGDEISMGWFSSGASPSNVVNLIYLELCGIVAKDMRTDGHIEKFFENALVDVREVQNEISKVNTTLFILNRELSDIEYEELSEKILNDGGVTFDEPKRFYIKQKDNFRAYVDSVVIEDVAQKTMTLSYRVEGKEVRKLQRLKIKEGMRILQCLYREHCMPKEEVEA